MPRDRPLTWFVDRCLGKKLFRDLRARGVSVVWHGDHFEDDVDDAEWIPEVASRGWLILSKDKHIRRIAAERRALIDNGAVFVCLGGGSMTGDDQIACVMQHWTILVALVEARDPPLIINLTKVDLQLYDPETNRWHSMKRRKRRDPE